MVTLFFRSLVGIRGANGSFQVQTKQFSAITDEQSPADQGRMRMGFDRVVGSQPTPAQFTIFCACGINQNQIARLRQDESASASANDRTITAVFVGVVSPDRLEGSGLEAM